MSWFVAVVFAPLLGVVILKAPEAAKAVGPGRIFLWYRRFLTLAMRAKWVTIAVSLALLWGHFSHSRLCLGNCLSSSDRPELLVDLSLPRNAWMLPAKMQRNALMPRSRAIPSPRWRLTSAAAPFASLPLNVQLPNSFFSQSVILARDVTARERLR